MSTRWHLFYVAIIAVLLAALLVQGVREQRAALLVERSVAAADLYKSIRQAPGRYQVLDLRDALEFEDGHLPQAINLERVRRTVVVTEDGDRELFARAAREVKLAVNLTGGMMQWRMSRLPEVSGLTDTDAVRRGRPG